MIFEHKFYIGIRDIDENNYITDKGFLAALEDTAGRHSEMAGFGLLEVPQNEKFWVVLAWHVNFIRRPKYNETLTIHTWSKPCQKIYVYRDFEIYDESGKLIATAGSKWVFINLKDNSITKVNDDMFKSYQIETKRSSTDNSLLNKMKEPNQYSSVISYTINREMIDIVGHVHNLNYLDLAYKALPDDVYKKEFSKFDIMYKKEIKLNETVKCFYSKDNEYNIVSIKSEDESVLHSIVRFE